MTTFQKYKKSIVTASSVIIAIFSLLGGLWAFENHYATNKTVTTEIKRVEFEVAGAIQTQSIKSSYQFLQFQYDKLTQDMMNIKRELRRNPDNQDAREDYQDVKQERLRIKQKMDQLMEKIQ